MSATLSVPQPSTSRPAHCAAPTPPAETAAPLALREWFRDRGFSLFDVAFFSLVTLFVGLLTIGACAMIPAIQPEAARWGKKLLSLERGMIQTAVLLVGGVAMTAAMAGALGRPRAALLPALLTALVCGAAYLVLLAIDFDSLYYRRLLPGSGFRPSERWVAAKLGKRLPTALPAPTAPLLAAPAAGPAERVVDAANGRKLFLNTCATCHGVKGEGMPGQGKDLRISEFVHSLDDEKLAKFIIDGRQPWDPANTTKVAMPGRGGNPMLKDPDIKDIVAHIRVLQQSLAAPGAGQAGSATPAQPAIAPAAAPTPAAAPIAKTPEQLEEDRAAAQLLVPKWVVPAPPQGPGGIGTEYQHSRARPDWQPPENAQAFFGVYLFATNMTGVQVLIATFAAGALALSAWRRRRAVAGDETALVGVESAPVAPLTARLGPPVLLAGVLWWWTTAAWIGMFILLHANG